MPIFWHFSTKKNYGLLKQHYLGGLGEGRQTYCRIFLIFSKLKIWYILYGKQYNTSWEKNTRFKDEKWRKPSRAPIGKKLEAVTATVKQVCVDARCFLENKNSNVRGHFPPPPHLLLLGSIQLNTCSELQTNFVVTPQDKHASFLYNSFGILPSV